MLDVGVKENLCVERELFLIRTVCGLLALSHLLCDVVTLIFGGHGLARSEEWTLLGLARYRIIIEGWLLVLTLLVGLVLIEVKTEVLPLPLFLLINEVFSK